MSVSGISGVMNHMSSGYRVNSAADDAAGLAISEKLLSQSNGYDVGKVNAQTGQDMLNVADGGLSSIQDSLQRMRELSVQASNSAIYSSDDIRSIQDEIDQLKGSIQDAAKGTQFNTMSLLDGSMADMNLATNPDGTGMKIQMANSTLNALGIANYDVTGSFDISTIDKALEQVSSARSGMGSASNALDHIVNYNSYASYNTTAARSRIQDLDYGKATTELERQKVLEAYRLNMQKKQNEDQKHILRFFD